MSASPSLGAQVQGIPTTVDVKGLELNTSMVGDPEVTAAQLAVRDWGRFQSPSGTREECPFKRVSPGTSPWGHVDTSRRRLRGSQLSQPAR